MPTHVNVCKRDAIATLLVQPELNIDDLEQDYLSLLGATSPHPNDGWVQVFQKFGAIANQFNTACPIFGYMPAIATDTDMSGKDLTITGPSALQSASTNQDGGNLVLQGGQKATGGGTSGKVVISDVLNINDAYTVAAMPTGAVGDVVRITDGDAALAWGATAVNSGGGATPYMVWHNGTNWTVMGI